MPIPVWFNQLKQAVSIEDLDAVRQVLKDVRATEEFRAKIQDRLPPFYIHVLKEKRWG